jgi:hypothetical protein
MTTGGAGAIARQLPPMKTGGAGAIASQLPPMKTGGAGGVARLSSIPNQRRIC